MKKIMRFKKRLLIFVIFSLSLIVGCENAEMLQIEPGMQALESKNYDKAIEFFKKCVDNEGESGYRASACLFLLGKAYYEKEQYKDAINYFKKSFDVGRKATGKGYKVDPMHASYGALSYWLGMAYYHNNQYKEAIFNFNEALKQAVEDPESEFVREWSKFASVPNVKFWRKYYLPLFPPKYACYFRLGSAYYFDKQYEQAVNALQKAIELYPKAPDFYTTMAAAYREMKRYNEAIAAVNRAIEIKPSDYPYSVLRSIYEEQGKLEQAISAGKKAIELNPHISHYFSLANLYSRMEDYSNNTAILQKAQELAPNNYNIPYALGEAYARLGRFDEAINSLDKAIMLLTTPSLKTDIGLIAIREGYPVVRATVQGAEADVKAKDVIIKINGESTKESDLDKISQILQGAKDGQVTLTIERKGMDKALERKFNIKKEEIQKVEIVNKNAAGPLGFRSLVYALKGDFEKADKDAKMAYSLNTDNGMAKSAISFSYIRTATLAKDGKLDEAINILSTMKDSPFDRLLESLAYSKMGDFKKSAEVYASIPEDYLLSKDAFRQHYKNAVLESLIPYVESHRENIKASEAKGQYREALKDYAVLLKMVDKNGEKQIRNRVAVLLKNNPYLQELPEEARKYALKAEVSTKEGKFAEAVKEYKKAIKIAPFFPILYKATALNYAELKEYQKAIDCMHIYLELFPDAPDARTAKDEIYKWEFMREKGGK